MKLKYFFEKKNTLQKVRVFWKFYFLESSRIFITIGSSDIFCIKRKYSDFFDKITITWHYFVLEINFFVFSPYILKIDEFFEKNKEKRNIIASFLAL